MYTSVALLGVGVATSILASTLSSVGRARGIGAVSDARRLAITPRSGAFVIWGAIYALLMAAAVYAGAHPAVVPVTPAALMAGAEVLSGLWVPLFLADTRASLLAAAVVLVAAATCALAAVALVGPLSDASWVHGICVHAAFGLFAGWLLCACVLGIGIAAQAFDVSTPPAALLALAGAAALGAALTRNPVYALPCMWALAWQPRVGALEGAGLALCALGAVAGGLRPH